VWYMAGCALLYGGAGLALMLRSAVAVWLLGAGLLMQAVYYGLVAPHSGSGEPAEAARWRKIWNAGIFSTAAFALAAYGLRLGVLA
jgi:hypothetical protein